MSESQRIGEIERRLNNVIRFGRVQSADYTAARVVVSIGTLQTAPLPWVTPRAGGDVSWWAPEVGEQVIVFSPSGETASGVVMPGIFSTAYPAPANVATKHRTVYADGTVIEYDREAHKLTANVQGEAVVTTTGKITVTAGDDTTATVTGKATVTASGDLTAKTTGGNVLVDASGNVTIKGSSITLDGPVSATSTITATGDVTGQGTSLHTHRHSGVQAGGSLTGNPV